MSTAVKRIPLTPLQIEEKLEAAFNEEQFFPVYQPQYNHSNGLLLGAEALVRWELPGYGMVYPNEFIPILEQNNEITRLDLYVFRAVCKFARKCIDNNLAKVPVSVNISRCDVLYDGFVDELEKIRNEYNIPVNYLHLELTESAVIGTTEQVVEFIDKIHKLGYKIEMDDFGSGCSSLNVLKDVDFDILKLDLKFVGGNNGKGKAGTIISSVVRMAKWLGLPVIAEGVETVEQADFMRSIGCDYIQGYLYSKPIPEKDYTKILGNSSTCAVVPKLSLIDTMNAYEFWSPNSLETLIFSNFVGGASIFVFNNGKTETLRVNQKYLQELGMNLSERDVITSDILDFLSDKSKVDFLTMLSLAEMNGEEAECELWWNLKSQCCGEEKLCIRTTVRMIGRSDDSVLFYAMIRNITAEKRRYDELATSEKRFKMASEQVNIYYWEYTVATKEMRPCFRCMRDMGLPALVRNYPEPAIEMGIFPPEVADMYRDWHKQIAKGVKELEAVMPLTAGRVPFRVKYTTEFNDAGEPVKAYGSATLIVE